MQGARRLSRAGGGICLATGCQTSMGEFRGNARFAKVGIEEYRIELFAVDCRDRVGRLRCGPFTTLLPSSSSATLMYSAIRGARGRLKLDERPIDNLDAAYQRYPETRGRSARIARGTPLFPPKGQYSKLRRVYLTQTDACSLLNPLVRRQARVRTLGSRAHCRVRAGARKASTALPSSMTPSSGSTPAFSSSGLASAL